MTLTRANRDTTATGGWSPIVELRQYTLHPGGRDVLIDLFDSELVEPQEAAGMKIIGQFRDLDDPNRFVWLRGFRDMPSRAESLAAFYRGPVWQAHRDAANATMIAVDDVLLLRPARPGSAFTLAAARPSRSAEGQGAVEATILPLEAPAEETEVVSYFESAVAPRVDAGGGSILGYFVTEASENTFPSLPVREGEQVFVWFTGFVDRDSMDRAASTSRSRADGAPGLRGAPHVVRLAPTARSLVHGATATESHSGKETR